MTRILETAEFLRFFPTELIVLVLRCNSLHHDEISHATNYPLGRLWVVECVALIAFIARRADSLHVPCVCNAMQRNGSPSCPSRRRTFDRQTERAGGAIRVRRGDDAIGPCRRRREGQPGVAIAAAVVVVG